MFFFFVLFRTHNFFSFFFSIHLLTKKNKLLGTFTHICKDIYYMLSHLKILCVCVKIALVTPKFHNSALILTQDDVARFEKLPTYVHLMARIFMPIQKMLKLIFILYVIWWRISQLIFIFSLVMIRLLISLQSHYPLLNLSLFGPSSRLFSILEHEGAC